MDMKRTPFVMTSFKILSGKRYSPVTQNIAEVAIFGLY